jgi:anti-sigma regulatory factor (Ser/Thr protein kinase)
LEVSLKILTPSDPRFLSVIRAAVGELGTVYGLSGEELRGIVLAVDEALANIIRHAYRGAFDRAIEVTCKGRADRLEFTLLDQGESPNPARLKAHPLEEGALSGRGTHIIRTVMDEVCYERAPRGNQLRLIKWLPAAASTPGGQ